MLLVVAARNGVLFLTSWEVMSLASFFLVTLEDAAGKRSPGRLDVPGGDAPGHGVPAGVVPVAGQECRRRSISTGSRRLPATGGVLFLLAVVGFGTKAGFIPLHVWLPEAHPAAPSHVSAVMSGVMIKTGIYGLMRTLTLLGAPPAWWGWTLVAVGVVSGILGVLYALAQHDLKRLLAYHSVENIGIIALGLGVGLLGVSCGDPGDGGAGVCRRPAARRQPRGVQEPAVPRRRIGAARDRHAAKSTAWADCSSACRSPATTFLIGAAAISRPAAAERLRQRVPDLSRPLAGGQRAPRGRRRGR